MRALPQGDSNVVVVAFRTTSVARVATAAAFSHVEVCGDCGRWAACSAAAITVSATDLDGTLLGSVRRHQRQCVVRDTQAATYRQLHSGAVEQR